eukprot:scaffold26225_cov61-Attheya_sp.AAC.2
MILGTECYGRLQEDVRFQSCVITNAIERCEGDYRSGCPFRSCWSNTVSEQISEHNLADLNGNKVSYTPFSGSDTLLTPRYF